MKRYVDARNNFVFCKRQSIDEVILLLSACLWWVRGGVLVRRVADSLEGLSGMTGLDFFVRRGVCRHGIDI